MATTPYFINMHILEAYTGRVYCRNIFRIFQDGFKQIIHCHHSKNVTKGGEEATYEVDFTEQSRG